jgi:hypothetical protein
MFHVKHAPTVDVTATRWSLRGRRASRATEPPPQQSHRRRRRARPEYRLCTARSGCAELLRAHWCTRPDQGSSSSGLACAVVHRAGACRVIAREHRDPPRTRPGSPREGRASPVPPRRMPEADKASPSASSYPGTRSPLLAARRTPCCQLRSAPHCTTLHRTSSSGAEEVMTVGERSVLAGHLPRAGCPATRPRGCFT